MKALKKVLVVAVCAALTLTAIPKANVEAAGELARYSFESMDGMSDAGLGTAPSIVSDSERGNVLQFADGDSPSYETTNNNPRIEGGSPSALKIPNPYEGSGLTSMTISYWQKVTDSKATEIGAGILGWVSAEFTSDHPDKKAHGKEEVVNEKGVYIFGASTAMVNMMGTEEIPMLNFAGLYHNWYIYNNEMVDFADSQWHHIIITTDSSHANTKVYMDGQDLEGTGAMGKRWNHGENDASDKANTLEPTLMEVIGMTGTELFIGHTGSSPTSSGVYIDDLVFYDSIISDADALNMYESAKASSTTPGGTGNVGNEDNSGQQADNNGEGSDNANPQATQSASSTEVKKGNSGNKTNTPNLPQTGVMSTTALVGIGVAVIGAGAVLLKKKEK